MYPITLGVKLVKEKNSLFLHVAFESKKEKCGIALFDSTTGALIEKYYMVPENRIGNIHFMIIEDIKVLNFFYLLFHDDEFFLDPYCKEITGLNEFGKQYSILDAKVSINLNDFEWGEDKFPRLKYEDSIVYELHVRGFTKDKSSKVKHPGTFLGLLEKLDYLKSIGITTVEVQPIYEFRELLFSEESEINKKEYQKEVEEKLNYWGYKDAYYYAPKCAYGVENSITELKQVVKKLHENSMELILQFYFNKKYKSTEIIEILKYWIMEYHIDGFHILGEKIDIDDIYKNPFFSHTKLWFHFSDYYIDTNEKSTLGYKNLGCYNVGYEEKIRKFLKGDEGMLYAFISEMRRNPNGYGVINYISNYAGFTLNDLVSYEHKHNERNEEANRDGTEYNYSWNCGVEGSTRKKIVIELRKKQIKNAYILLFLSQGVPLVYMGDEFGNTQYGNNNPYCQDNKISWLDWKLSKAQIEQLDFFKNISMLRKEKKIFRMEKELKLMDYKSCGFPDISYHAEEAWAPSWEFADHQIGVMLCGIYSNENEEFWYIAINMHWEEHLFAMPKLPKGMNWQLYISTNNNEDKSIYNQKITIASRSISIFKSI